MSVLPTSASLLSFFIVLAIFLLTTVFIALYLVTFLSTVLPRLTRPFRTLLDYTQQLRRRRLPNFIQKYINLLNPAPQPGSKFNFTEHPRPTTCFTAPLYLLRRGPADLVHYGLIREVFFLRDLYRMWQYRDNIYLNIEWSWTYLARDIVRAVFLPVWAALIAVIVAWLIVQDLLFFLLGAVCFCCWSR